MSKNSIDISHPRWSDFFLSLSLSLLLVSPYFLERVKENSYYAFNIWQDFLIPHLLSVTVLALFLFVCICITRLFDLTSRFLMLIISGLLLIFMIRGLLAVSGVSPQIVISNLQTWLFYLGLNWFDNVTLRRVGVIFLFGLGCVLMRSSTNTEQLFRSAYALGFILGIITIFRVIPLIIADDNFLNNQQIIKNELFRTSIPSRRVVWVIFDELDYNRLVTARSAGLVLPNIDRLSQESITANDAVSPAWVTSISIPALITGDYLEGTNPLGPAKLLLRQQNGKSSEWSKTPTIFSKLKDTNRKVSILGYYHPYCSLFPYVNTCFSQSVFSYPSWWWGIWQSVRSVPGVDFLSRQYKWTNDGFNKTTLLQLKYLDNQILDKTNSLSFVHLNIPHLPGRREAGLPTQKRYENFSGYDQNLLVVDSIVGKIVDHLEDNANSQKILLVISSDHWLRIKLNSDLMAANQIKQEIGNSKEEVHKIPFFIRYINERSHFEINKPINTVFTAKMIEEFLEGKITDHASIMRWWTEQPYINPMIDKSAKFYND
jgi:hypothetical protein